MDNSTARFDADAHAGAIRAQGFTVIPDFMEAATIQAVRDALAPYRDTHRGRNDFEGFRTERIYTLVARGKVFEALAEDARVLALMDRLLLPGYLLTASQAIRIDPGETAQDIHSDDGFYRMPRPRAALSYTLVAAVDAFTQANGGTEVIPGSHLWDVEEVERRKAAPGGLEALLQPMEMPAGACVVFAATLLHRGGANTTDRPRQALTNQYCEPWVRPQENWFLAIPREQTQGMSERLQRLLGYEIWPPFIGMVTASHPLKTLEPGWVPPVAAQRPSF
ncbi:phytanoyl-CoA dioxygenase family protein [Phenylobacterium sp.]|uniref:phytanoyl-CoA dioxygenase family protein n=1 Tax=Phenylobacterium sp. TaxID=1871053 RepID=UPI00301E5283